MAYGTCAGCGTLGEVVARGWCDRCYRRWLHHGDPAWTRADGRTRFESRVDRSAGPDGCHPWLGRPNAYGYGRVTIDGKARPAQAVAWEMVNGPLPVDPVTGRRLEVDHECHNAAVRAGTCRPGICAHRLCCNERHLVPRTPQEHNSPAVTEHLRGSAAPNARLSEADVSVILAMLAAGIRQVDVAASFGLKQSQISEIKLGKKWRQPDAVYCTDIPRGSQIASAILGESDIPEIRAALGAGESLGSIARRYGVSLTTIHMIKHRRTWRHVS